jgi:ferritin-like metal-binding protein YciE
MPSEAGLRELFVEELKDVYHAEKQLTKALPKLAKAASSPELREAFEAHLEETEGHVGRLEKVFKTLDEPIKTKVCVGMQGIIEEGSELIKEQDKGPALDAGLIAGAQRAEHYEMAVYGSLIAWAKCLEMDGAIELLEANFEEERAADEKLTALAEEGINDAAANGLSTEVAMAGDDEDEADEDDDADEKIVAAPRKDNATASSKSTRPSKSMSAGRK